MTTALVWLGLAWMVAAGLAVRWWSGLPFNSEVEWVPKEKPGGLCPYCEQPWLTWTAPSWAKCLRCRAYVHADMIMRLCRDQECRNLTPSYRALKQGMYCDEHRSQKDAVREAERLLRGRAL